MWGEFKDINACEPKQRVVFKKKTKQNKKTKKRKITHSDAEEETGRDTFLFPSPSVIVPDQVLHFFCARLA